MSASSGWSMIQSLTITLVITCWCGRPFSVTTSAAHSYCRSSRFDEGCAKGYGFGYPFFEGSYYSSSSSANSTDGYDCGYPELEINCHRGRPVLNISNNLYYVLRDNVPGTYTIRVVAVEVDEEECPRPTHNLTISESSMVSNGANRNVIYFYNCSNGYPESAVQHLPCLDTLRDNNSSSNSSSAGGHPPLRSFAFPSTDYPQNDGYDWYTNCQHNVKVPVHSLNNYSDYTQDLKAGFGLDFFTHGGGDGCWICEYSGGHCLVNEIQNYEPLCSCEKDTRLYRGACKGLSRRQKFTIGVCIGIGSLLLSILCLYRRKWSLLYKLCRSRISSLKAKIKTPSNVELFLESVGCFGLQRYRYSEIKKITHSFRENLGHGGFGSVFKGKLQDGRYVAVKVLNELKGNGEDFINEVATIGRTNHINVVSLLGFCSSGTKRALVYEFMSNGSLEKLIYGSENASITNLHLGWEKLYQIALGIAKGLEYLHHGCNTRILHFDIKPHNILLNEDLCPKITDFGLAKLCPTRQSIISMIGGRGTTGYIAPEVGNRVFGGVSNKSDVYSYGMMILEMIGGRKNMDLKMENMSEIYFPLWIYNHFQQNMNVDCKDIYKEEPTRKMITVALWCIQMQPTDRPSMSKVVEMLEGNIEDLQMPPNPFQNPPSRSSP